MWLRETDAALARDRAVLHHKLTVSLNFPGRSKTAGPCSPHVLVEQAKRLQRRRETSRYIGVHWDARRERWASIVCEGRRKIQVVQFDDEEAAAIAYDRVARAVLGESASLNFPDRRLRPASLREMREWARSLWKMRKASLYRGVTQDRRSGAWIAQASKDGVHHHLGSYANEIDAAKAYDRTARKLWGKQANLNFP